MGREAAVMDWEQKFPFLREKGHVVSLIGGGGKTTLLYALSAYCTAKGWRVLTATTTHIRKPVNVPWIAVNEEEKTASLECESINTNKNQDLQIFDLEILIFIIYIQTKQSSEN